MRILLFILFLLLTGSCITTRVGEDRPDCKAVMEPTLVRVLAERQCYAVSDVEYTSSGYKQPITEAVVILCQKGTYAFAVLAENDRALMMEVGRKKHEVLSQCKKETLTNVEPMRIVLITINENVTMKGNNK